MSPCIVFSTEVSISSTAETLLEKGVVRRVYEARVRVALSHAPTALQAEAAQPIPVCVTVTYDSLLRSRRRAAKSILVLCHWDSCRREDDHLLIVPRSDWIPSPLVRQEGLTYRTL